MYVRCVSWFTLSCWHSLKINTPGWAAGSAAVTLESHNVTTQINPPTPCHYPSTTNTQTASQAMQQQQQRTKPSMVLSSTPLGGLVDNDQTQAACCTLNHLAGRLQLGGVGVW